MDGAGTPLLLRGANLGGWLLWESYLIRLDGEGWTESRIKQALVDMAGRDAAYAAFRAHRDSWTTRADIHRMHDLGFNVVRIPLNARVFDPQGHFDLKPGEGWTVLDRALDWCEAEGVYAILDLHSAPGGQNGGGITDTDLKRGLFNGDSTTRYREATAELWGAIARRYRARTVVAALDLLNEPAVPREEGGGPEILDVYRRCVAAVRAEDPRHMLMVEGNWYATDFSFFGTPPLDANLCYQFHKYWNATSVKSIAPYLELRRSRGAPVWLGETGENSTAWYRRCVGLMEDHGIGWCFWPWKRMGGGCLEPVGERPAWKELAAALKAKSSPRHVTAVAGLQALATAGMLERCTEDRAVVDALTGARVPVVPVPGRIEAEDFRPGSGTGYLDHDPVNKGGEYREDEGVDVEGCEEGGYDVGWIEAGEWLTWDSTAPRLGAYDLVVRYASETGGGAFTLAVDGVAVGGLVEPAGTGGWQAWADQVIHGVRLAAGLHALRLDAVRPGFNLDYLELRPAAGGGAAP